MCMVMDNEKLVHYVIKKYYHYNPQDKAYEDLYQEGMVGLCKAVKYFNPSIGCKFSTYAAIKINSEIQQYFRDRHDNTFKISRDLKIVVSRLKRNTDVFNVTDDDIKPLAERFECSEKLIKDALECINVTGTISLDLETQGKDKNIMVLSDIVTENENPYGMTELNVDIESVLNQLGEQPKKIFTMYYIDGINQPKIAQLTGIRQAQVSRVLSRTTKVLREALDGYYAS